MYIKYMCVKNNIMYRPKMILFHFLYGDSISFSPLPPVPKKKIILDRNVKSFILPPPPPKKSKNQKTLSLPPPIPHSSYLNQLIHIHPPFPPLLFFSSLLPYKPNEIQKTKTRRGDTLISISIVSFHWKPE